MTVFTEGRHAGEFLMSEAAGTRSRDTITIPAGTGKVEPGTVLGKLSADGALSTAVAAVAGNTGNGAITKGTPATAAGVKVGVYRIVCIEPGSDAGTFSVEDPDGVNIGVADVGVAFDGVVKFTIADGGTDFAAGDAFTFTVTQAAASGEYVPSPEDADDGSEIACAINIYGCDATDVDCKVAAITGEAEVNGNILVYEETVDDDAKKAAKAVQLAAVGIKVR